MGSESTSRLEVRNSKSRKRTKKKDKSKDFPCNADCDIEEPKNNEKNSEMLYDQGTMHKKRKGKRKKVSNGYESNGTNNETSKSKEEEIIEKDENEGDLNEEASSPKKHKKLSDTHADDNHAMEEVEGANENEKQAPKAPSKRQLKREKAEKKENEKREASRLEATQKALNYVSKWKHARSEWKFVKIRQIWLIDNLLDVDSIPDDIFPTVLEYFEGCKGMAREQLLKKGMDVIRKVEDDEENKDELMESVAYKRARSLLQALPTET